MATRILVVDDEPRFIRLVEANLVTQGYEVTKADNGQKAVDLIVSDRPDLVLLDVMMPVLDGFEALKRIRAFSTVPIIMLTAKGEEIHRVRGLELGADDYIVKPFSANELLARVNAVIRRAEFSKPQPEQSVFQHGNLQIDLARAKVEVDGEPVLLSSTEYRLLLQFARQMGEVLTAEELLTGVWGPEYREDKEILWVCISRLRQKLESDPKEPEHILTRPGRGYMMPSLEK